jgi:hypothetical protein
MIKADLTRKQKQLARNAVMSSRPELRLDWCTHEAAKYAVEHWHYSRTMPKSKLAKIGVWENKKFIGCVIFGVGATRQLVVGYGLKPEQGCELVRVSMTNHVSPVTRIIAVALRLLRNEYPGLRLVVSFADPDQGHHGGIYQGGGWIYTGRSSSAAEYVIKGERLHGRVVHLRYGTKKPFKDCRVPGSSKHRYLMPLDDEMRRRIEPLRKPYPKRAGSAGSGTSPDQGGRGGATPTPALTNLP